VIAKLAIGDFWPATHLGIITLRHYDEVGLFEPVNVDADTGYGRYTTEQIVTAQIIRHFRDLDIPLAGAGASLWDVRALLHRRGRGGLARHSFWSVKQRPSWNSDVSPWGRVNHKVSP
jgi:DNA-binding transcriptional MerR regulator